MAEREDVLTFLDIAKMIADKYNVSTELVEDIIISFFKVTYEAMRSEFEFPELESKSNI